MADEVVAPAVAPAAEVAPAPAAEVAPAPAVEIAPAAEVAPPAEAPVVEEKPAAPERPVDLLKTAVAEGEEPPKPAAEPPKEGEPPKVEEKVEEPPKEGEPPKEPAVEGEPKKDGEQPPAEAAAPQRMEPLAEYKYELPAEIVINDEQRGAFHTAIENARNGEPQELINLHHQAMSDFAERTRQGQIDSWNTTLQGWHEKTLESFGGEQKFAGVAGRVATIRDKYGSTEERGSEKWQNDMAEFNHMLDSTGVGNHPVMWRFMDRLAEALGEPRMPTIIDPKPAPTVRGGIDSIYTNPRSPKANGAT